MKRVQSSQSELSALDHCVVLSVLYKGEAPSMLNVTGLMACGTIGNLTTELFSSQFDTCARSEVLSVVGNLSSQFA